MNKLYPRILIALYHSWIDTSSGAAISLRETMKSLAARGWSVRVLCGPLLDFGYRKTCEQILDEQKIVFREFVLQHSRRATSPGETDTSKSPGDRLLLFHDGPVPVAQYLPFEKNIHQQPPDAETGSIWLKLYQEQLNTWKPDIVLTYGGYSLCTPTLQIAKTHGIRTVFYLCNFAYTDASLFHDVSATITASQYHAEAYRHTLGIESIPIYPLIRKSGVLPSESEPADKKYVTFVNPIPHKGVFIFAKIAEILSRERPDIPLLIVEGRAGVPSKLFDTKNNHIFRMRNTPCPADYYRVTRILLVPSLWQESFGRVAAEAMMCGIPVLASNRGSLPEVVGDDGFLFDIPPEYTPESRKYPTEDEVRPWTETLIRLWDDPVEYTKFSERALHHAQCWDESRIMDQIEQLFRSLLLYQTHR